MELKEAVAEVLRGARALSISLIIEALTSRGVKASLKDVYVCLWEMERDGLVKRVYDEDFDVLRPAQTVKWALAKAELPAKAVEEGEEGAEVLQLILSVPPSLADFKEFCRRYGALYFLEALEAVVSSAEQVVRIMCPYVDATLLNVLMRADKVRRGYVVVKLMSEGRSRASSATLDYIRAVLRNAEVRHADRYAGTGRKQFGVHAKCISADDKLLLLGSFNIAAAHIAVDLDVGVLISGYLVKTFNRLFDDVWESLPS